MSSKSDFSYSEDYDQVPGLVAQKFQESGVIDKIKLLLRQDIIKGLQDRTDTKIVRPSNFDKFWTKVTQCFVANYLKINHYECTLAIFLPEGHLTPADLIDTQQLCTLLGFGVRQYEDFLLQISKGSISALEILIKFIQKGSDIKRSDHSSQTDNQEPTYDQRMSKIEDDYLRRVDYFKLTNSQTLEQKIDAVRRECEAKYNTQLVYEVQKVREYEVAQIQLEERSRVQRMLQSEREKIQHDYQQSLTILKEKEASVLQRLTLKMQEMEREQLQQRDKIITELNHLEMEKVKFHRHKCEDTQVVQDELQAVQQLKSDLNEQIRQCTAERAQIRERMKENIQNNIMHLTEKQNTTKPTTHFDLVEDIKVEAIRKEYQQIKQSETHKQYLSSENEALHKEILTLQQEKDAHQAQITQLRQALDQFKDATQIEQVDALKQKMHVAQLEVEVSKSHQICKDLDTKLGIIRDEQIHTHKMYSMDMDKEHQIKLQMERDMSNRIHHDLEQYRLERQTLIVGQEELESRIEELMIERDESRKQARNTKWQQKQI